MEIAPVLHDPGILRQRIIELGAGLAAACIPSVSVNESQWKRDVAACVWSLAIVGGSTLLLLPVLIAASFILQAPVAAPAAVALGYLPLAHALARSRGGTAALLNSVLFPAFVALAAAIVLAGDAAANWGDLTAMLLVPGFAAAPAVVRALADRNAGIVALAQHEAACLDRLAPREELVFLDRAGTLLAGSRAGLARLGLASRTGRPEIADCFERQDRAVFLQGLARCRSGEAASELTLRPASESSGQQRVMAEMTAVNGDQVMMRLRAISPRNRSQTCADAVAAATPNDNVSAHHERSKSGCDLTAIFGSALPRFFTKAQQNGVTLSVEADPGLALACGPRFGRRLVGLILEDAVEQSETGDAVTIAARASKGVVMVSVFLTRQSQSIAARNAASPQFTKYAQLAEEVGGAVLIERRAEGCSVRIRLPAAVPGAAARPCSGVELSA